MEIENENWRFNSNSSSSDRDFAKDGSLDRLVLSNLLSARLLAKKIIEPPCILTKAIDFQTISCGLICRIRDGIMTLAAAILVVVPRT